MTSEDQKRAFEEENRVAEALLKLSVNSSRESQRLQAIKTLWTSKLRAQGTFQNNFQLFKCLKSDFTGFKVRKIILTSLHIIIFQ